MRPRRRQMPPREQAAGRVAERHPDDRERAEQLRVRLRADEDGHADEPDRDAEQPPAGHALVVEEAEREHRVEDRHGRLDDRREARVDPRLAPREEPERDGRVQEADDDERPPVRAQVGGDRPPVGRAAARRPPASARPARAARGSASTARPRRSATLMNMNELPQISASAPRSTIGRLRVILVF